MAELECLLALGANLGSEAGTPRETLVAAFAQMAKRGITVQSQSALYRTPAFPAGAGPDFVNAAAVVTWPKNAADLMRQLHEIEYVFGRTRALRWGERTLDLDLLAAGDAVFPDLETWQKWRDLPLEKQMSQAPPSLITPHPRMQDRAFVLVPLAEIAPDWRHPVTGLSVRQMCDALPQADRDAVQKL